MKAAALVLSALFVIGSASPARAQLGGLGKIKSIGDKAVDAKGKYDDYNVTEKEERQLGEQVSLKLRDHFGVYQNAEVTKYVALVGTAAAQASKSPTLDWQFIVLDTDGVNAYAAPGGIVHITRGLLGLLKSEAELAGVLGHEITHITNHHTVDAIKQAKGISIGADVASSGAGARDQFIAAMTAKAFNNIFEGQFSQSDESHADQIGIQLANKLGYAPSGMADVLKKIEDRNASRQDRNGFFSSHPAIKERIANIEKQIKAEKLTATATVPARYAKYITFDAKPITEIAVDVEGAAGLASGDKKKDDDKKAEDKDKKDDGKKKGIGSAFGAISGGNKQAQSSQQVSSAGARGGVPDRDAKGGPNKNPLGVKITAAELEAFKKGIAG
ncbi:MAG TPA: M48 family metalloprotease [Vicinamibacterales bacterium]|nr:M48 family metalloprotease [Vicinamibacterales bacterium]